MYRHLTFKELVRVLENESEDELVLLLCEKFGEYKAEVDMDEISSQLDNAFYEGREEAEGECDCDEEIADFANRIKDLIDEGATLKEVKEACDEY